MSEQDAHKTLMQLEKAGNLIVGKKSGTYLKERRKKVWTLQQVGLNVDKIVETINTPEPGKSLAKEDIVTKEIVLSDLERLKSDFQDKVDDFNEKAEVGEHISKYDLLYEEVMTQYYECPVGSAQRAKFLDLAKQLLDERAKFLQGVGLVEKVANKQIVQHQTAMYDKFTPEQKKLIEDQLLQMTMQQTEKKLIIDVESEKMN